MTEDMLHTLQSSDEDVRLRTILEFGIPTTLADITTFVNMLADKSWRVRKAVVRVLAQSDVAIVVPLLVRSLSKGDAGIQNVRFNNSAIECLTEIGQPAISGLADALQDDDKDTRIAAANALGAIHHHDATHALIAALHDDHINVRYAAVEALSKIPSQHSVLPLTQILEEDEEWLKLPAISALGNIGDPRATPHLINIAQQPLYLQTVIEALGNIGDERGIPCIIEALGSTDKEIRKTAVLSIKTLTQKLDKIHAIIEQPTQYREVFHSACTEEIIHNLVELIDDRDFTLVMAAIKLLGWSGRQDAAYLLLEKLDNEQLIEPIFSALIDIGEVAISPLADAFASARSLERKLLLLDCLHELDGEAVLQLLLTYFQQSQEELLVYALLKALTRSEFVTLLHADAAKPTPQYFEQIKEITKSHLKSPHPLIRAEAIHLWGALLGEKAIDEVFTASKDADPTVRVKAIIHLGRFAKANPDLIEPLIIMLSDDHSNIRKHAALALGCTGNIEAFPSLLLVLDDPNAQVRRAAVSGIGNYLSQHGQKEYEHQVLEQLRDVLENRCRRYEDGLLKIEICHTLQQIISKESQELLLQLAHDVDFDVRKSAILTLGAFGRYKHTFAPQLREFLTDQHWSVREAAVVALGQLQCQDAKPELLAMLDDPDLAVRKALCITLGQLRVHEAVPIFVEYLALDDLDYAAYQGLNLLAAYDLELIRPYAEGENPKVNLLINHILERNKT